MNDRRWSVAAVPATNPREQLPRLIASTLLVPTRPILRHHSSDRRSSPSHHSKRSGLEPCVQVHWAFLRFPTLVEGGSSDLNRRRCLIAPAGSYPLLSRSAQARRRLAREERSEALRVGTECVSRCKSGWCPHHKHKKN